MRVKDAGILVVSLVSRTRASHWLPILTLLVGLTTIARPADAAPSVDTRATPALAQRVAKPRLTAREQALRKAVNTERRRHGLAPIPVDSGVQRAARDHTADMIRFGYFGHSWHDNRPMGTWVRRYTACTAGEIIAWRSPQQTARSAVQQWLDSPGHRAELLASTWAGMGVELRKQHATIVFEGPC